MLLWHSTHIGMSATQQKQTFRQQKANRHAPLLCDIINDNPFHQCQVIIHSCCTLPVALRPSSQYSKGLDIATAVVCCEKKEEDRYFIL